MGFRVEVGHFPHLRIILRASYSIEDLTQLLLAGGGTQGRGFRVGSSFWEEARGTWQVGLTTGRISYNTAAN